MSYAVHGGILPAVIVSLLSSRSICTPSYSYVSHCLDEYRTLVWFGKLDVLVRGELLFLQGDDQISHV